MAKVITNIPRASSLLACQFAEFGVATVHEAQSRTGLCDPKIRPIYSGAQISGSVVTCEVAPGDNWMIHVAAEQCQAGDILVVTPTSPCCDGYFGDLLATSLQSRGVLGLIIDAGVRDVMTLKKMQFPVWSSSICAQGTVKETIANVNTPITCAGAYFNPGDIVVADDDGVVVVARKSAEDVLKQCQLRADNEEVKRQQFENGELGLDVYSMRQRLVDKGLIYVKAKINE